MTDQQQQSKALVVRPLTPTVWQMVREIAPAMHQSRLFGVSSPEQAMAIMLKGFEIGLGLTASFEYVQIIGGRASLSPRGCLAVIHQHSDVVECKIEESTEQACTVWMRRRDTGFEFRRRWTIDDAKRAGVIRPDSGWDKYPSNMLLWRTVGFVADVVCPDLIGGMKRADELGAAIDRDGNIIDGQWASVAPAPAPPTVAPAPAATTNSSIAPAAITLDQLVERYGPEAVMSANDGRIPSESELPIVAEKLRIDQKTGLATDLQWQEV